MKINDRFPHRVIAKTNDSAIAPAAAGPWLLPANQNNNSLKDFAEHILRGDSNLDHSENLENADASHARPSVLAHFSAYCTHINHVLDAVSDLQLNGDPTKFNALHQNEKDDFAEWQGMLAAIALNAVYSISGLNITIREVALNGNDPLHRAIQNEFKRDEHLKRYPQSGERLFYICQNGTPFAIFHPSYGAIPLSTYSGDIFAGCIPWYDADRGRKNAHKGWRDFASWITENPGSKEFLLNRLYFWCDGFKEKTKDLWETISYKCGNYKYAPVADYLIVYDCFGAQKAIDAIFPGNETITARGTSFSTVAAAYCINGVAARISDIFLDQLLIQYTENPSNNKTVYVTADGENKAVKFEGNDEFLQKYAPVLPFSKEIIPLLGSVSGIEFIPTTENGTIVSVRAEITFRNDYTVTVNGQNQAYREHITFGKIYGGNRICQTVLPYMMVWPYLQMPAEDSWKCYYATWATSTRGFSEHLINSNEEKLPRWTFSSFEFDSSAEIYELNRYTDESGKWQLRRSDKAFRYAFLRVLDNNNERKNEHDAGLILFPKPELKFKTFEDNGGNGPVQLAIDFGTTSTVCAIANVKGNSTPKYLPFKDYSKCVTCLDANQKKKVDEDRWLGKTLGGDGFSGKFFSIAQIFARNNRPPLANHPYGSNKPYLDGRMLLADQFLIEFATAVHDNPDSLQTQRITNDMKFSGVQDTENTHAAALFLSSVYLYAVLYLIDQGITPNLLVKASYPNGSTLKQLQNFWGHAQAILTKVMNPSYTVALGSIHYYEEAMAAAKYYEGLGQGHFYSDALVSIDIGGGTTDISVSDNNDISKSPRTLSVRYAGRQIMVDSLIECYRRWPGLEGNANASSKFRELWDDSETADAFSEAADVGGNISTEYLRKCLTNRTLRLIVEYLLNNGLNMGTTVNPEPNFLREMITLKFIMLMTVVSRFIAKNIDFWPYDLKAESLETLQFDMQISGTASQLLQYALDSASWVSLNNGVSSASNQGLMKIFCRILARELSAETDNDEEKLLPNIQINFHVNDNPGDKIEVCHGLLAWNPMQHAGQSVQPNGAANQQMTQSVRDQRENQTKAYIRTIKQNDFEQFVEKVVEGIKAYEDYYTSALIPNNGPAGETITHVSELITPDNNKYNGYVSIRNQMANDWSTYMVEFNQEPYRDLLSNVYVLDEYLNKLLADLQHKENES